MGVKNKRTLEPILGNNAKSGHPDDLYTQLNRWIEPKLNLVFWLSMALTILLGIFFFDPKVSLGGDDSMYINRAFSFINQGKFPTFQGPLYPILLGMVIYIAGLKLILLKSLSLLFLAGHLWFYFKAFKRHLSPFLLAVMLIILSTNYSLLYMGSSTYTEPLYLLFQSLFIYLFDKNIIANNTSIDDWRRYAGKIVMLAGLAFLMSITRSIGLTVPIAAIAFLVLQVILQKNKKVYLLIAGIFLGAFLVFHFSFELAKKEVWGVTKAQTSGQMKKLFYKNYYKEQAGTENFDGYVKRVKDNSVSYIGHHFYSIFGLTYSDKRPSTSLPTLLIYALLIAGFFLTIKKDPFWTLIILYIGAGLGVTFVLLQTFWAQERLILVFTPLLMAVLLHTLHLIFYEHTTKLKFISVLFPLIILATNTVKTASKAPETATSIQHYMRGDLLYGFSQDWINYLAMAKWSAAQLPGNTYVACRKPGMAFIYAGGKEFYGIWRVPPDEPKELYDRLKNAGVTHIIMAHLLVNPEKSQTRTINTVRRYLSIINKAYPGKLKVVHKIGDKWPAYLYEIQ